jgi:hypothetical protein
MSEVRWTEYDPYTGVTEINISRDDDDEVVTHRMQDVEPLLAVTAETRNTGAADAGKKNMRLYCSIPVTTQYELLQKGINVFNPDHMPRVLQEINRNYPKLKYTDKTHEIGSRKPLNSQKEESSTPPGPFVIVR